jgi:hypothetical protein
MGFLFTFRNNKSLFYSGDINISASYLKENQPGSERNLTFNIGKNEIEWALFEGAFIGRDIGIQLNADENLMARINSSITMGKNHILLSSPSDYGLYMYLYLYDFIISGANRANVRVFLDPIIITQLEMLGWRIKRGLKNEYDASLTRFAFRTLAESAKVYDLFTNIQANIDYYLTKQIPMLFILDDNKVGAENYFPVALLSKISAHGLDITRVGRACGKSPNLMASEVLSIADFNGGSWFMHTPEPQLKDYLLAHQSDFGQVILFHNFNKRLRKFSRDIIGAGFTKAIKPLSEHYCGND